MAAEPDAGERITEAEQAVMEALWARSPLTAGEVADAVAPQRGWGLATVKTLLSRLVAKQAAPSRRSASTGLKLTASTFMSAPSSGWECPRCGTGTLCRIWPSSITQADWFARPAILRVWK